MTQATAAQITARQASDEDLLRAQQYRLLARLLAAAPDEDTLRALSSLKGDDTRLGRAYGDLAEAARATTVRDVADEYFTLFVGVGRGELLPYASFYLTGFLNERPLADLRGDLLRLGVARAEGRFEPEDHIATLCEIMAGLAAAEIDASLLGCGSEGEAGFFARHLDTWAEQFFDDLAKAPGARFYRAVAPIGSIFIDIERRGFALDRPDHADAHGGGRHGQS